MILVTGCTGFIGSHFCESLLQDKLKVLGVDNFDPYYDIRLKKANLSLLKRYNNFNFYSLDITDRRELETLFSNYHFTTVVHLAARPGVSSSLRDPISYYQINILGTINLLEQLKNKDAYFIFGSSSSVYGNSPHLPFCESEDSLPLSPYGISKKTTEHYCSLYHTTYGLPITILRFFTVYGPRVRPDMAIMKFTKAIDANYEIVLYNRGLIKMDFTYIDNIVSGIRKTLEKKYPFEIFNLGNNKPIKIKTLVDMIEKKLGKKAKRIYERLPEGEMVNTWAEIEKAQKMLLWQPRITIEEGLDKFINWYKKNK